MVEHIVEKVINGDVKVAAKLIRDIDDGVQGTREILKSLHRHTGNAYIIGITGAPGVGKSTVVDQMIRELRKNGKTVGVLAIDPTSPLSGGAILGDRVRMQRHSLDEGVFIRSLATRGQFGGLTQSTRSAIDVLDAMGKDYIIIETVGVGQDEIDIAKSAHTTVIVVVPGMGDHVQAIKAGIFEVGDIFLVNKSDRPDAERTLNDIKTMIDMTRKKFKKEGWEPSVLMAEAVSNKGIVELLNEIEKHRKSRKALSRESILRHKKAIVRFELIDMIKSRLVQEALNHITESLEFQECLDCIIGGAKDPYSACDELLSAKLSFLE
ncbi:MAG TPA: methylmalonyl Co-A mutase-associated GTPase MeaB [Syntrophorhabdales bacterium]|nr:methylmalonyl Co-A mutase-associated GTPase MeaB [Syntrophorhabdales bacterium]